MPFPFILILGGLALMQFSQQDEIGTYMIAAGIISAVVIGIGIAINMARE